MTITSNFTRKSQEQIFKQRKLGSARRSNGMPSSSFLSLRGTAAQYMGNRTHSVRPEARGRTIEHRKTRHLRSSQKRRRRRGIVRSLLSVHKDYRGRLSRVTQSLSIAQGGFHRTPQCDAAVTRHQLQTKRRRIPLTTSGQFLAEALRVLSREPFCLICRSLLLPTLPHGSRQNRKCFFWTSPRQVWRVQRPSRSWDTSRSWPRKQRLSAS